MTVSKRASLSLIWLCAITGIGVVLYYVGLSVSYYGDDYKIVFDSPASKILYYWTHSNPNSSWYRPIEASLLALNQSMFGLDTLPLHILQLALHIVLSWLVFTAARDIGFTLTQSVVGSLYMIVCQINVLAIVSNDTISQLFGAFFGYISLWFYYRFLMNEERGEGGKGSKLPYITSLGTFTISTFSKESSVGFLLCLVVMFIMGRLNMLPPRRAIKRSASSLLPYSLITVGYFALRSSIVARATAERYDVSFGLVNLKNIGLAVFGALVPTSSVQTFEAFTERQITFILVVTSATIVLILFLISGLRHTPNRRMLISLFLLTLSSLFPAIVLRHMSELYVYNAMPLISLLFGAAVGLVIERTKRSSIKLGFVTICCVGLFVCHALAIQSKSTLMLENGARSSRLLNEIIAFVSQLPPNSKLYLVNPGRDSADYSVFILRGFNVLNYGLNRIEQVTGRADVTIQIIPEYSVGRSRDNSSYFLGLSGQHVSKLQ